jgi:integral membrane sensor domain MASE1
VAKKKVSKKIVQWLLGDIINVNIRMPAILLIYFLGIPAFAYFDFVLVKKSDFVGYVFVCSLEFLLVYIGYTIANAQYKLERRSKK